LAALAFPSPTPVFPGRLIDPDIVTSCIIIIIVIIIIVVLAIGRTGDNCLAECDEVVVIVVVIDVKILVPW